MVPLCPLVWLRASDRVSGLVITVPETSNLHSAAFPRGKLGRNTASQGTRGALRPPGYGLQVTLGAARNEFVALLFIPEGV